MTRRTFVLPLVLLAAGCGSDAADEPAAGAPEPTGTIAYACGDPPRLCTMSRAQSGRVLDVGGPGRALASGPVARKARGA